MPLKPVPPARHEQARCVSPGLPVSSQGAQHAAPLPAAPADTEALFSITLHLSASSAAEFVLYYQQGVFCGNASVHINFANFLLSFSSWPMEVLLQFRISIISPAPSVINTFFTLLCGHSV